jgi:hypothetical protein
VWSTPRPGHFIPGKETRYPLYRRLSGWAPRPVLKGAENSLLQGFDAQTRIKSLYRLLHPGPRRLEGINKNFRNLQLEDKCWTSTAVRSINAVILVESDRAACRTLSLHLHRTTSTASSVSLPSFVNRHSLELVNPQLIERL